MSRNVGCEVASTVVVKDATGEKTYCIQTDNLGSIQSLTDQNGDIIPGGEFSFDPWGNLRNKDNWTSNYLNDSAQPNFGILGRGFTGHEHISEFGLINMNGRVYDQKLGQFIQPDNYIQNPGFSQSYNRYSYCINNPVNFTDPSGELFGIDDIVLVAIAYTVANITVNTYENWKNYGQSAGLNTLSSSIFGAVQGAITGAGLGAVYGQLGIGVGGFSNGASGSGMGGFSIGDIGISLGDIYNYGDELGGKEASPLHPGPKISLLSPVVKSIVTSMAWVGAAQGASTRGLEVYGLGRNMGFTVSERLPNGEFRDDISQLHSLSNTGMDGTGLLNVAAVFSVGRGLATLGRSLALSIFTKQVANVIPKGKLANHIFSGKMGKLADTPVNRDLITNLTNNSSNFLGKNQYGQGWYAQTLKDGTQLYGYTYNGIVKGAGINTTPIDIFKLKGLK